MLCEAFTGVRRKSEPLDCHHLSAVSSSTFASHCTRKRLRVILLPFRTCGFSVTAWLAGRQATLFCLGVFMQVQNIEDTPLCSPFFFFLRGFSEQPTTAGLEESRPYMWHSEGQPRKGISLSYWEQSRNQSGSAGIRGGMLRNNDSRGALRAVLRVMNLNLSQPDCDDKTTVSRCKSMFSLEAMIQQLRVKTTDNTNICSLLSRPPCDSMSQW